MHKSMHRCNQPSSSGSNMHNSMVASNYKVSNYIPDDLGFSILSKLPFKYLKRFGSVSKSWSILFENPNFMSMYRINFLSKNHACYKDTSVLLHHNKVEEHSYDVKKCELYSLSGERFETRIKLDLPDPFPEDYENEKGFDILGSYSINGILCLSHIFRYALILWNPATKEFKVIPRSPGESIPQLEGICFDGFVFGYDCVRDDYKVIQYVQTLQRSNCDLDYAHDSWWEIYSLRSNSWKKIDFDLPRASDNYIFMDGVGHWWSRPERDNEASLESFDFSTEIFFTTPIPSDIMGENFDFRVWRDLVVLNGFIALIVNYRETSTFHISILGEVGVKDSWTKLFVFGLLSCIKYPIGVWKNGVMFLRKDNGELVWFDSSTHIIEELGFGTDSLHVSKIVIYKESFLPIGGVSD